MATKQNYLSNTYNLEILNISKYGHPGSLKFETWEIYTIYRGQCRAVKLHEKVSN